MSDAIRVIYIEDDDMEAMLFKLGLEKRGIEVLHLPGATVESLATLQQPEYLAAKAIFMDMWVGVVNGMELASMLRKRGNFLKPSTRIYTHKKKIGIKKTE